MAFKKKQIIIGFFIVLLIIWSIFARSEKEFDKKSIKSEKGSISTEKEIFHVASEELEKVIEEDEKKRKIENFEEAKRKLDRVMDEVPKEKKQWKELIPVLVFACNRARAVREHVQKLISARPSTSQFPIIISQDCDDENVRQEVITFGKQVQFIKHIAGDKALDLEVPFYHSQFTTYYRISRHYKLALEYVFNEKNYSSVIITEDDLDIAPDFFSYFASTRYLLEHDPTLYCVTAWNDNGKADIIDWAAPDKLYRSDFFAGLGWMMTRTLWQELSPRWPAGFWDDWLREPTTRKNRQCIRPEVSRTGMMAYGEAGASKGQFFTKHLAKILTNKLFTNFSNIDLDYLLEQNFEQKFTDDVENARIVEIQEVPMLVMKPENMTSLRVMYEGNVDFIRKADALRIMHDFKAGVPRTAYQGVVTCFINGIRVFLTPDRAKVPDYDVKWNVPLGFGE